MFMKPYQVPYSDVSANAVRMFLVYKLLWLICNMNCSLKGVMSTSYHLSANAVRIFLGLCVCLALFPENPHYNGPISLFFRANVYQPLGSEPYFHISLTITNWLNTYLLSSLKTPGSSAALLLSGAWAPFQGKALSPPRTIHLTLLSSWTTSTPPPPTG